MKVTPARAAALLTAVSTLAAALTPAVADLDWTSTAGVFAGVVGLLTTYERWMVGQRSHEARQAATAATPAWTASTAPAAAEYTWTSGGYAPIRPVHDDEPGDPFDGLPTQHVTPPELAISDHIDRPDEEVDA